MYSMLCILIITRFSLHSKPEELNGRFIAFDKVGIGAGYYKKKLQTCRLPRGVKNISFPAPIVQYSIA